MTNSIGKRLEQYTNKRPQEVLLVTVEIANTSAALNNHEEDTIAVFKGFSSSLMRPTAFDPDVPVLPDEANILSIDRVASPYNPEAPRYIQQGLSWESMQALLLEVGV
ncbi:hypothetical protein [Calothrix sp. PCC 7507]|uniref:DUF7734 family protein n=1 Tax=Calothrix sp. PCC 7507 TaxID=99598 RepID=UPI00029ECED9|nr:hypothetical protein [Calothrix sp. PCC 7507]AFY30794.1 hypothetical protein Cal7507_0295 [Calothrix sp. PCC 7507]